MVKKKKHTQILHLILHRIIFTLCVHFIQKALCDWSIGGQKNSIFHEKKQPKVLHCILRYQNNVYIMCSFHSKRQYDWPQMTCNFKIETPSVNNVPNHSLTTTLHTTCTLVNAFIFTLSLVNKTAKD